MEGVDGGRSRAAAAAALDPAGQATRRTACSARRMTDAALILGYEAMRGLRGADGLRSRRRWRRTAGVRLADEVFVVAILRAGLGLVDEFPAARAEARVGHLGMYRDEEALRPVGYYENIPSGVEDAEVFVVDPMLAHRADRACRRSRA